jgi:hypothetical protein
VGEPFVAGVLRRRLAVLDQLEVTGHELHHAPPVQIAGHARVEILLKRVVLVLTPFLGQGAESVGHGAGAVLVEVAASRLSAMLMVSAICPTGLIP